MIRLTRFNHTPFVVNSDAIKFVEGVPDTTVTLINGERFLVLETVEEVVERIVAFRREIWPAAAITSATVHAPAPCDPPEELGRTRSPAPPAQSGTPSRRPGWGPRPSTGAGN